MQIRTLTKNRPCNEDCGKLLFSISSYLHHLFSGQWLKPLLVTVLAGGDRRRRLKGEDDEAERKEHHKGVAAAKVAHLLRASVVSVCLSTLMCHVRYSKPQRETHITQLKEASCALGYIYTHTHKPIIYVSFNLKLQFCPYWFDYVMSFTYAIN